MTLLLCGLFLFIATHSVRIFAEPLRTTLVARMGEWPYKGVLAVLSLLGFWLLLTGYAQARLETWVVWTPPAFLRHIMWLLMLFALVLLVAAYVPRNHLKKRLKHPMVLSVKVWALAHLLVNGQMHQMVLFGAFLVWAVLNFRAARKRDALANALHGEGEANDATQVHNESEAPSAQWLSTLLCLVIGGAAWAALLWRFHAEWFGVSPLGAMAS
ncbi:MAG: NnrU family protein [Limnohabitans sp.]